MVTCIKRMPRIMASDALASLWQGSTAAGTDLAGIIIGNDALNSCRCSASMQPSGMQLLGMQVCSMPFLRLQCSGMQPSSMWWPVLQNWPHRALKRPGDSPSVTLLHAFLASLDLGLRCILQKLTCCYVYEQRCFALHIIQNAVVLVPECLPSGPVLVASHRSAQAWHSI